MTSKDGPHSRARLPLRRWLLGLTLPVAVIVALLQAAVPASAANVVNVTIHYTTVEPNPCTGDSVALSGDQHMVITTTTDNQGGFHFDTSINSQFSGSTVLPNANPDNYVSSDTKEYSWYTRIAPAASTTTLDHELISKSGTENFLMHSTLHETVNAQGIPTAMVDNVWLECKG